MFNECTSLTALNLSNFSTSNVTDMSYMFNGCQLLVQLDLSNFDTTNVIEKNNMFIANSLQLITINAEAMRKLISETGLQIRPELSPGIIILTDGELYQDEIIILKSKNWIINIVTAFVLGISRLGIDKIS
jgi:surface protein